MKSAKGLDVILGLKPFLRVLFNGGGSLISLVPIAYIIGWLVTRSYLAVFGATWLLSETPFIVILERSAVPLALLAFLSWLDINDLYDSSAESFQLQNKHVWLFAAGVIVFSIVVQFILPEQWKDQEAFIRFICYTALTSGLIGLLLTKVRLKQFKWNLPSAVLVYSVIYFGFYLGPGSFGEYLGKRDYKQDSELPVLYLETQGKLHELRLLLNNQDRFYGFYTDAFDKKIRVVFVKDSHLTVVQDTYMRRKK